MKRKKSASHTGFKTGSKVVCITDDFANIPPLYKIIFRLPVANQVYTIRGKIDEDSIWLKEIVNDVVKFPWGVVAEPSFYNGHFKPLAEHEEKISERKPEQPAVRVSLKIAEETDVKTWFVRLSDNKRLSLFMKRINTDEKTVYDDLLSTWWMSRY